MAKRILIVEDEPRNLKLMRDLLTKFHYEVIEATDGEQGVEAAKSQRPDLILMDIMMPKMDGLEATRLIREDEQTKGIPVVALTSFAMKGDQERTIQAGCNAYIAKPVDIKAVLEIVARYVQA